MSQGVLEIISWVASSGILGGAAGWFFSRRKYNAEVKNAEVNNFDAAIDAYKKMYDNMIFEYKQKNEELSEEVNSLKRKLEATERQVLTLTNYILGQALGGQSNIDNLKDIIKSEEDENHRQHKQDRKA